MSRWNLSPTRSIRRTYRNGLMEIGLSSCTECGAHVKDDQSTCPKCHRPRWYTLKKISICLLILASLAMCIKIMVTYGDRTLSQWFG